MKWSIVLSNKKEQMNLFRDVPSKIRYLTELPDCGVCKKKEAKYHAPTKFGIWADICESCSKENTDNTFNLGYKLIKYIPNQTGGPLLDAIEVGNISVVVVGLDPRRVACPICKTERQIDLYFIGAYICKSCLARVRVTKLF